MPLPLVTTHRVLTGDARDLAALADPLRGSARPSQDVRKLPRLQTTGAREDAGPPPSSPRVANTDRHVEAPAGAGASTWLADASVHLVVTSPPYPMITMWDGVFDALVPGVGGLVERDPDAAFEAMHGALDRVWAECARVLVPGGMACVNVGDATRTIGGTFRLFPNHARILAGAARAGFQALPDVLWRKPTNAPNKFMGSGMLPGGAYVTYEHEYVLILRNGPPVPRWEGAERRRSAYFWEERNGWFSDLWTAVRGTTQAWEVGRDRSAAFPLEIPWRLVHMYSVAGEVVLDPFAGTATTLVAAAVAGRSSVGIEVDGAIAAEAEASLGERIRSATPREAARLTDHAAFVTSRLAAGKPFKHHNAPHDLPVVTSQETALEVRVPESIERDSAGWTVRHRRA